MSRITCLRKICFGLFTALMFSALSSVAMAGDFTANLSSPATNTSGNYTVTWTGGTYYSLQEKKNSGNWTNVYSGTGSSKSLTGRGAGTYKYRMNWYFCFPFMNQCFNLYSEEVTTVVNVPVPSTPGGISGPGSASYTTSGGASYSLSWGASTGTVTNYEFQEKINSGSWATVQNNTTRSKGFSGKNSATYYYRVRACNGGSCSGFTSTKTVTVTASYLVSASTSSTSSGNFSLSWTVPGSFTTYQVEQSLNGGSWGIVASTGSPSHSFSNKPDGSYQFRVKYCFTLPIPPYSTVCTATSNSVAVLVAKPPGIPASIGGVPATDNNGAFTVSWGTASGTVTSYRLEQQKNGGSWVQIYSGTGTSKAVSGLGDGSYKYRVRACNSVGCSSYRTSGNSIVANAPPTPSSISGVPATDNNGAFTVSWPTTTNADNYRLEQQKNGASWTQIYNSTGISKAVSGLADGTYRYRVRACNTYSTYTTCSGYRTSGTSVVANMPGTPASIAGVPATDNNGAFTVSWGTGSGPVDNYRLEQQKNGGSWTQIHSGSTSILSKAISALGDGTYKYRIRACNTFSTYTACSGYRTSGSAIVANAPGTPPSISGVPTTDNNGAFTVSWGAASGTVDAYHLYQKTNSGSYAQIYTGTATSFAVTGLADATYTYRVRARNTYSTYAAYSGYRTSNSVLVQNTPGNPGSISGPGSASYSSPGGASYSLSWAASSGNISAYELQEQINSGSWTTVQTSTTSSKPFSGKNEATYKYRVRACNGGSCTAYGAQKTVAVTANYSLSSSTSNSTNGSFSLSWTNPNSHPIFQVEEKFNSGSWTLISQKTTASHSLSNKPNGTYNYRIQYCITLPISPYSTVCSSTSNSKQVVVSVPAPSQPTGITGPSSLNYSVPGGVDYSIDWANSTGTVTAYDLERKVNSGNWADVLPANTTSARSFNDDLAGSYQYRVRACNGQSCSGYSPTKTVTVTANYSLTATPAASSNGNLSLSWTNPGSFTTFQIEEQVGSGSWNLIGATASTTFTPPNKADGTYNYRIQYCFTLPISPYSTVCTETSNTDQVVVTHPPGIPPSISTPGGDDNGAFSVSWTAATGVSPSYTLERENNGSGSWTSIYTGTSLSTNVVTGLADGSYKFRVKACNVGGCSAPKISTATLVANKPGVPGTIIGDAGTVNQSVALSWPAATGNVDKYTLQQRFNGGTWTT
ncbi:fibronectin type III domain-containing protein, partial [Porticoccaceae bacterium]|nr:fibronectin type III domain-containing protein [Porticoccaceae bacterium]